MRPFIFIITVILLISSIAACGSAATEMPQATPTDSIPTATPIILPEIVEIPQEAFVSALKLDD